MTELLKGKVRKVEEKDRGVLKRVSYSRLSVWESCPYQYQLKYIDGNYADSNTLPLEIGSCLHRVLELKADYLIRNEPVDEERLLQVMLHGDNTVTGVQELKRKYFEEWFQPDNASGRNYEQKVELFRSKVLKTELTEETDWHCISSELPFEFVYNYAGREIIMGGFIDRVDQSGECLRVIDYKTSKKRYDDKAMATPLQQVIYGIAVYTLFGKLPDKYEYRFILLDERQEACRTGYLKRGLAKLDKLMEQIDKAVVEQDYKPKPTPLCYWCDYHGTSPNASAEHKGLCLYYSLWTPNNKTFEVNKQYREAKEHLKPTNRKLIF